MILLCNSCIFRRIHRSFYRISSFACPHTHTNAQFVALDLCMRVMYYYIVHIYTKHALELFRDSYCIIANGHSYTKYMHTIAHRHIDGIHPFNTCRLYTGMRPAGPPFVIIMTMNVWVLALSVHSVFEFSFVPQMSLAHRPPYRTAPLL